MILHKRLGPIKCGQVLPSQFTRHRVLRLIEGHSSCCLADEGCDLVLSSGFLAFAYHSGFLEAVAEAGIRVRGVMGTSSGALSGALYSAGYSPIEVSSR